MPGNHPLSAIFLLHAVLEAPIAIQGILSPRNLPFLDLNNTSVVFIKNHIASIRCLSVIAAYVALQLYSALAFATCVMSLLCYPLPEYLPGKRALAIALCIYHSISSTILYGAPRFVPISLGPWAEAIQLTPETLLATVHGVLGLLMVVWWQGTLHIAKMSKINPRNKRSM